MDQKMRSFWAGVRAEFPLLIGVFPFGLIYGTLALKAGLSPVAAQMMSSIVFAGSSQFITAQLIHDAAPGIVIVLTIAIVNLRHMLYSASIAPYFKVGILGGFITGLILSFNKQLAAFCDSSEATRLRGAAATVARGHDVHLAVRTSLDVYRGVK